MKIFYITRSYFPQITGGTLVRKNQVEILRKSGYEVVVVTPNYSRRVINNDAFELRVKVTKISIIIGMILEKIGIVYDYLFFWENETIKHLKKIVSDNDVLYCVTGGELACMKIGHVIKKIRNVKFVVNYHDPIDYTCVNGMYIDDKFHAKRDKYERKILHNADLIITSSKVVYNHVCQYADEEKVLTNYIGYMNKYCDIVTRKMENTIRICYAGAFTEAQKPEILLSLLQFENIELYFIGPCKNKMILSSVNGINCFWYNTMEQSDLFDFINLNIDFMFISLTNNYFGACIPSKLFDCINLEKPILACLPDGDCKDIIMDNKLGIVINHDENEMKEIIGRIKDRKQYLTYLENIKEIKDKFLMKKSFEEVLKWLENL